MTKTSVIRLNRDGPKGTGLAFWGHLENENVIEGDPTEIGHNYFTDSTGPAETFKRGDSFVIPKGLKCEWRMPETTRKYYVILDTKAAGT